MTKCNPRAWERPCKTSLREDRGEVFVLPAGSTITVDAAGGALARLPVDYPRPGDWRTLVAFLHHVEPLEE